MAQAKDPYDQFHSAADALAAASGFNGYVIGYVFYRPTGLPTWQLLALRAELVDRASTESKKVLESPNFGAVQKWGPLSGFWNEVEKIRSGQGLVREQSQDADRPIPAWYQSDHSFGSRRAASLRVRLPMLSNMGLPPLDEIDAEIRAHSSYQWASLSRLIFGFCQQKVEHGNDSGEVQFFAPWPIGSLTATRLGAQVRLELAAVSGLNSKRLIVNVEGPAGDERVPSDLVRWLNSGPFADGLSTYAAVFEPARRPVAVNVFVDSAPQVSARAEIQESSGWTGALSPFERSPVQRERTSDLWLRRIELKNFKILRAVTLDLTPLTVIVGPNQTGKSTLLEGLDFLAQGARGSLAEAVRLGGGIESLLWRKGRSQAASLRLGVDLEGKDSKRFRYEVELASAGRGGFEIEREILSEDPLGTARVLADLTRGRGQIGGRVVQGGAPRELMLSQIRDPAGLPEWEAVRRSLASCALFGGFDTSSEARGVEGETLRGPARPDADVQLSRRAENLSAALYLIRESAPKDWELLMSAAQLTFDKLKDIRFPAYVRGAVHLRWVQKDDTEFDAYELSAGTMTFLASACALLQRDAALITIDEPEIHLHPDAIQRLIGLAQSVSRDRRILLTTQSSNLLGLLDESPECLAIAQRSEDGATIFRPDAEMLSAWLKEFSLSSIRPELETWSAE